jgi:hypothetical protein
VVAFSIPCGFPREADIFEKPLADYGGVRRLHSLHLESNHCLGREGRSCFCEIGVADDSVVAMGIARAAGYRARNNARSTHPTDYDSAVIDQRYRATAVTEGSSVAESDLCETGCFGQQFVAHLSTVRLCTLIRVTSQPHFEAKP